MVRKSIHTARSPAPGTAGVSPAKYSCGCRSRQSSSLGGFLRARRPRSQGRKPRERQSLFKSHRQRRRVTSTGTIHDDINLDLVLNHEYHEDRKGMRSRLLPVYKLRGLRGLRGSWFCHALMSLCMARAARRVRVSARPPENGSQSVHGAIDVLLLDRVRGEEADGIVPCRDGKDLFLLQAL